MAADVRRSGRRRTGLIAAGVVVVSVLFVTWGLIWGLVPLSLQTLMLSATPDAPEASSAMFITVSQLAIAVGAAVGGLLVDSAGLSTVFVVSGIVAIVAGIFAAVSEAARRRHRLPPLAACGHLAPPAP